MNFVDAVKICFAKYADFNGRASRPEYWWFFLAVFLGACVTTVISRNLYYLFALATILPSLAAGARRLHDTGRSGWWQLLYIVPFGCIVVWIFQAQEGKPGGEF
jgi:uncharacterized membrane protein YhaH (DUF805 family)